MNIKFLHRNTIITLLLTLLATTANATDWLGRISDDMPVCRLSIPGTHDAATGEGFIDADTLAGNYIARLRPPSRPRHRLIGHAEHDGVPRRVCHKHHVLRRDKHAARLATCPPVGVRRHNNATRIVAQPRKQPLGRPHGLYTGAQQRPPRRLPS